MAVPSVILGTVAPPAIFGTVAPPCHIRDGGVACHIRDLGACHITVVRRPCRQLLTTLAMRAMGQALHILAVNGREDLLIFCLDLVKKMVSIVSTVSIARTIPQDRSLLLRARSC